MSERTHAAFHSKNRLLCLDCHVMIVQFAKQMRRSSGLLTFERWYDHSIQLFESSVVSDRITVSDEHGVY